MSVSKELRFKDVDGKETTIEFAVNAENIQESNFTEAKVRENLKSGENLTKMLGKLAKWFTDLSKLAWSGKWADVGDKPGIGDLEGTLGVEKGGTGATSASGARTKLGIGAAATYPIADNDTTNNANYVPTARIVYEHGKEIDALSRDIDTILQKLSRGFRIELSIGQYIWKPENESQWHGSGDSARITLEISADGIAIAKVTNPGDFRAYGTDHGRINKVGIVSIHPL